ncbi:hypothetical protein [Corynebacterium aurimucosum]|uniref:hypothetical protein n=1 Tax=Corynebacterium aurimucosum TaxID=169292 RepID=UPI0001BCEFBF|nr:hypothetical protein [Corynebacterium aurimucosum]QQU92277.1 hypothetical protein I6I67_08510 [Corynebacterium aurimucosum]QQU92349.1 hypothetical protein I6I67_08870 [Corynebacterium aurimucosum]
MSKHSRAAKAIKFGIKRGYAPDQIATLLDKFGLLAEDLLEPSFVVKGVEHEYPVWDATHRFTVEAQSGSSDVKIRCYYDPGESLTLAQARTIRQALHAAENYAENQE